MQNLCSWKKIILRSRDGKENRQMLLNENRFRAFDARSLTFGAWFNWSSQLWDRWLLPNLSSNCQVWNQNLRLRFRSSECFGRSKSFKLLDFWLLYIFERLCSLGFRILNWQTSLTHFQVSTNIFYLKIQSFLQVPVLPASWFCRVRDCQRILTFECSDSELQMLSARLTLPASFRLIILAKNRLQNHLNIHKQSASWMGERSSRMLKKELVTNHQLR